MVGSGTEQNPHGRAAKVGIPIEPIGRATKRRLGQFIAAAEGSHRDEDREEVPPPYFARQEDA